MASLNFKYPKNIKIEMVNSKMKKKKETSSNRKKNNDNNEAGILDQTRRRPLQTLRILLYNDGNLKILIN